MIAENRQLRDTIQSLEQQLDWFKRQLFGQKSEKRLIEANPDQGSLFEGLVGQPAKAEPTDTITYQRRQGKKPRSEADVTAEGLRFSADVPLESIALTPAQLRGPEADQYDTIGEKRSYRLAQRPGSYVVLEYIRPIIKHKASEALISPPMPSAVFPGCIADVSVLAGILVDKFAYHLPLYRQHQRLADAGITLSRSTLTNWVKRSIALLEPIVDAQLQHILQSRVLAVDETPIKAGMQGKGKLHQGWFWPVFGEDEEIVFTYSPTRATQHLESVLGDSAGTLLSDGYSAYDCYAKQRDQVTQAQCWVHTRREFLKAEQLEPEATAEALELIAALYVIEQQMRDKDLTGAQKRDYRALHSLPVVDRFFAWCHEQRQRLDLTPSNPLTKALAYATKREAPLRVFLSDPEVPPDTNHLERALRVIPMGRRNWLFCWSEVGAKQVGVIQSLLTTCRMQGVDPYVYLVDVLQRVSLHPNRDVIALTPRLWKERFAKAPLRSDLALKQSDSETQ
ncbi:IS66 family transposase [Thiohalocapsa marina]|uniref:IS66 family transposase n=1 Tax=Thiohalocapsa marina TaxID=424902 RepID=A0A5M8FLU0_9GAMM|nr:IS66 family transposase [Thiohalocapsa marina]